MIKIVPHFQITNGRRDQPLNMMLTPRSRLMMTLMMILATRNDDIPDPHGCHQTIVGGIRPELVAYISVLGEHVVILQLCDELTVAILAVKEQLQEPACTVYETYFEALVSFIALICESFLIGIWMAAVVIWEI